ncbi:MAG TPA: (Na+)-NQR maturation NqrM [Candidatus Marinimicrobia bacterium]|jgi:hypothetical protein|nr:(Na+)-NQR maturation NqrM [Candidatus Neomarinimicrobiota bacterium]HIN19394.1 (Na+)-NQR maturation NqrM [Candidatus Neomarinimicrobiota bacterium]
MEIMLGIVVIAVALLAMSIGVIFNNKPLKGSCGGQDGKIIINGIEMICPACGGKADNCESNQLTEEK